MEGNYIGLFECGPEKVGALSGIIEPRMFIKDAYSDYDEFEHKFECGQVNNKNAINGFWYKVYQLSNDEKKELYYKTKKEMEGLEKINQRNNGIIQRVGLKVLIGQYIVAIYMNEDYLSFETERGDFFTFGVDADCCSTSVFYDFIGADKILKNKRIMAVNELDLRAAATDKKEYQEYIQVYGYEIVTNDDKFGLQTSVVSFRNYSNGYYGGNLVYCGEEMPDDLDLNRHKVTEDAYYTDNCES